MTRWGMTVDLNRCVGCQTCTIACKHANATPPGVQWRRVIDVELGTFPDVERLFVVTGCQHCENPPCVPVCPSGATARRDDGLVTIDYDLCIGCASCVVACPYQARTIVHEKEWYYGDAATAQELQRPHMERLGVANKCTFCIERLDEGLAAGLTPGRDMEATPACAASCIAQALKFGDYDDPDSEVARLVAENKTFQMHAELGTEPRIRYLYEVPATTPGREVAAAEADMANAANPLTGKRQHYWDYRAAMNFALGGMAAGLAVVGWLMHLAGLTDVSTLQGVNAASGAVMAVGLFVVFLKLGRKTRLLYVLLRPQTSWMTRETYCVALFYPAVGASILWPSGWLFAVAGLAAAAFLVCQGQILYRARGIPSWRAPEVPWMLSAAGLFEGLGLFAVIAAAVVPHYLPTAVLAAAGVGLAGVNAWAWLAYRRNAQGNGIGPLARADIAKLTPVVVGAAHLLPGALFALAAAMPQAAALAGLTAAAGGFFWKFMLVTRVCHQQGFALPRVPQRGSGAKAAPAQA
ncbi:MAG: 4Fe-4S dicluster domain-containing protein [Rhodospirillaceae bacterium]